MKTPQDLLTECKYMEAYEGDPTPEYDTGKLLAAIEARDAEHAVEIEKWKKRAEKLDESLLRAQKNLSAAPKAVPSEVIEVLKKMARIGKELSDGTAEYWEWGNSSDTFEYGMTVARDQCAVAARECLRRLGVG